MRTPEVALHRLIVGRRVVPSAAGAVLPGVVGCQEVGRVPSQNPKSRGVSQDKPVRFPGLQPVAEYRLMNGAVPKETTVPGNLYAQPVRSFGRYLFVGFGGCRNGLRGSEKNAPIN